jgi:hypothetical protein
MRFAGHIGIDCEHKKYKKRAPILFGALKHQLGLVDEGGKILCVVSAFAMLGGV